MVFSLLGLVIFIGLCFYLLAIVCDEFFIPALDKLSKRLRLSPDVAGATLMAMGSSAPEVAIAMIVLILPSQAGIGDLGAGTIVGSAIFNVLVITGLSSLFHNITLKWQSIIRDLLFYGLSVVVLLLVIQDGLITSAEAVNLLVLYLIYVLAVLHWQTVASYRRRNPIALTKDREVKGGLVAITKRVLSWVIPDSTRYSKRLVTSFIASIGVIAVLSYLIVEATVGAARILEVPNAVIALTILAAGTSIPDTISSLLVAQRGQGDMAVSNAVGSNTFNILVGLGFPWGLLILVSGQPVVIDPSYIQGSVYLLFASILAMAILLWSQRFKLGRKAGLLLLLCYLGYLVLEVAPLLGGG